MQVRTQEYRFGSADGRTNVYAKTWIPDVPPQFIVQIVHGMVEYIDRYDAFARYLCSMGAVVQGHDHLGHGRTAEDQGIFGHFADKAGQTLLVEDIRILNQTAHANYPDLPLVIFGHSLGSFLARQYAAVYGDTVDAVILSGTGGANNLTGAAKLLARVAMLFGRARRPGHLLTKLAFGRYNDRIEEPQSANAWLSRDPEIVRAYDEDPFDNFRLTNRSWYDFMCLLESVTGEKWSEQLRRDIGYLLISGAMDPVGGYGDGVREVMEWMRAAGIDDITMHLYEDARHELTNETNRDEVFSDIRRWIRDHIDLGDL